MTKISDEVTVYYYGGCRKIKGGIRRCTEEMKNGDVHIYGDDTTNADGLFEEDKVQREADGYSPEHKLGYGNDTFRIVWKKKKKL